MVVVVWFVDLLMLGGMLYLSWWVVGSGMLCDECGCFYMLFDLVWMYVVLGVGVYVIDEYEVVSVLFGKCVYWLIVCKVGGDV